MKVVAVLKGLIVVLERGKPTRLALIALTAKERNTAILKLPTHVNNIHFGVTSVTTGVPLGTMLKMQDTPNGPITLSMSIVWPKINKGFQT